MNRKFEVTIGEAKKLLNETEKNELRVILATVPKLANKANLTFDAFFAACNAERIAQGLTPQRELNWNTNRNWTNRVAKSLGNDESVLLYDNPSAQAISFNIPLQTTLKVEFSTPIKRIEGKQISPQVKKRGQTFTIKGRPFLRKSDFSLSSNFIEAVREARSEFLESEIERIEAESERE